MCTCDFYRYEHIYTYRKKEFQNILESKKIGLDSCSLFNLKHGTEHDIDIAYRVCMH